jgi:hypothetical protein
MPTPSMATSVIAALGVTLNLPASNFEII